MRRSAPTPSKARLMCSANSEHCSTRLVIAGLKGIVEMKETRRSIPAGMLCSMFLFCAVAAGQGPILTSSIFESSVTSAEVYASGVFWVQQAKLTASDGQPSDLFGFSSATNGEIAVVGMEYGNRSEAYLFVRSTNGWGNMTETARLTPSDGQVGQFGYSVAISGETVIIGAPGARSAYVYVKPLTGWVDMTETAKLTTGESSGYEVAVSGDVVVSGSADTLGENYVFVKPRDGWKTSSRPTAKLHTPEFYASDSCGFCIGINGDTIAVGVPTNFIGEGTVYVFVKPTAGWHGDINPSATLIASDPGLDDYLGWAVSANRDTVVASAPDHADLGAIYVFVKPAGGWVSMTQTAELAAGNDLTGTAVGVSANGKTIVAGSPLANVGTNYEEGATYVFNKPTSGWKTTKEFNAELTALDGSQEAEFGASVGVSGNTVVTGAPIATVNGNYAQGAAYVFVK
jgi:hypothetical protein